MVEVPCPYGGVVTARFGEEGTELPVGRAADHGGGRRGPPAGGSGERGRGLGERPGRVRHLRGARAAAGYGDGRVRRGGSRRPAAAPGPRPRAARPGRRRPGAGRPGAGRTDGPVPVISPLVRRLARENGLDLQGADRHRPRRADPACGRGVRAACRGRTGRRRHRRPSRTRRAARRPPRAGALGAGGHRRHPHPAQGHPRRRRRQAVPQPPRDPGRHLLGGRRRHGAAAGARGDERRRRAEDLPARAARPDLHGGAGPLTRSSTPPWTRRPGRSSGCPPCTSGFAAQTDRGLVVPGRTGRARAGPRSR